MLESLKIQGVKLHLDSPDGQRITGHGAGWIEVNGERHDGTVMIGIDYCRDIGERIGGFGELARDHPVAKEILEESPVVVLVGTGKGFAMAPASFASACYSAGIGVESMDTPAACRTYNVIAGEGRQVVALLFH